MCVKVTLFVRFLCLLALEFAYTQSPVELRGVVMGLYLLTSGFGFYVASALVSVVKHASDSQWYPDNFNKGSPEYYMFLLAGLMMVNVVVFLLIAMKYQYADCDHKMPESQPKDQSEPTTETVQDIVIVSHSDRHSQTA